MVITEKEATRLVNFAVFSYLRNLGSVENLEDAVEYARTEFCAFCEAEGITDVDTEADE